MAAPLEAASIPGWGAEGLLIILTQACVTSSPEGVLKDTEAATWGGPYGIDTRCPSHTAHDSSDHACGRVVRPARHTPDRAPGAKAWPWGGAGEGRDVWDVWHRPEDLRRSLPTDPPPGGIHTWA